MEVLIMESLKKVILTDLKSTNGLKVESTKESGEIIEWMLGY